MQIPKRTCSAILFLLLGLSTLSCTTQYVGAPNPHPIPQSQYDQAFQATLQVLDQLKWAIDEKAYNRGVITTGPKPVPGILEPFSSIKTTPNKQIRATINDERAFAQITLLPLPKNKKIYQLHVEVVIERLIEPLKQLTGATQGHGIFSKLTAVPTEWKRQGIDGKYWDPVDRDPAIEQKILQLILNKIQTNTTDNAKTNSNTSTK